MNGDIERIRAALQFVDSNDRETWLKMAFAIKDELGDAGRDLWEAWSQQAETYQAASARDIWKSTKATGPVKIGTLFRAAKMNGWSDDGTYQHPTPAELDERRRMVAERAAIEEVEVVRERACTAMKAEAIYQASIAAVDTPYLLRKRVSPVATLREIDAGAAEAILGYAPTSDGVLLAGRLLVVPVHKGEGLSTLELIDGDGRKAALSGRGTKAGGYWATGRLPEGNGAALTLLIGEGVGTVLSAKEAGRHPGIATLSSGNLQAVAQAMRERYPAAVLVILADLVKASGDPDPHAIAAAQCISGKLAIPSFGVNRDFDMKDFNDMAQQFGTEAVAQCLAHASEPALAGQPANEGTASPSNSKGRGWLEPQPLFAKMAPEPYPIDALPLGIRAAVEEVAGFVKAPMAMVVSSALAALSLAIQAHVNVMRLERLHGPVGLFLIVIADSGERKSTCDGIFMKPVNDYEKVQAEAAKPILKDHTAAIEAWEAKRAGVKEKIRQLAKDNKPTEGIESVLRELEHTQPKAPRIPRLLYADATPEALAYGLATQWPSGGVVSAEAGIVLGSHGMGKDSVMRNLGLFNRLWDGNGITIERRSTESFKVQGARLTVALQVQEPTLREFFARSGALARGTGFIARFLLAWPESTQGMRRIDPAAPDGPKTWPHLAAFHARIAALLEQPALIDDEGALVPRMLPMAAEAKAAWVEYHNSVESKLSSSGELYDVRDVASKSADNEDASRTHLYGVASAAPACCADR